ncbi:MAG: 5-(carboxyamino)imidazole ribonucleotide mutase [Candidatus Saccharimonadales bacterium]
MSKFKVGIIMGSESDLDIMSQAATVLDEFDVPHEVRIISAHRTPEAMMTYASTAKERGLQVIIAGAGGSAHLPGMTASHTLLPVLAVPVKRDNHDHEALYSNIKMPPGIPLATMPENGAKNAALMAIEILALSDEELSKKYAAFKDRQRDKVIEIDQEIQKKGWQSFNN